jgi:RNA polymerase sigma-70 factor (ECF subfamily)
MDPVTAYELKEMAECALACLTQEYRDTVQAVYIDGMSYAEASHKLSVPLGTVMSRLNRAKAKMAERLKGYYAK